MDEILASIRRIIETGEDRSGVSAPRSETADAPTPRTASSLPRLPERFDTRDLPAGVRASNPVLAAAASDISNRVSASMAQAAPETAEIDDEAQLTAELEQELAATWGHPEPEISPVAKPAAAPESGIAIAAESSLSTEGSEPMSDLPSFDRRPDFEARVPHRDEPQPDQTGGDRGSFNPANSDRPVADDRYEPVTLPLTSESTGTLVAASFNDLAQAIRSGELRSIEAMAQEMLRPMLQEWLDDNLPRMVERLVREEIERMSRGGRR